MVGALALAATNQIFSLMDPYIFRKIIDDVAAVYRSDTHTMDQFVAAIWPLALASVGVAFVSRVAKNFQDYFINTVTQKPLFRRHPTLFRIALRDLWGPKIRRNPG